MTSWKWYACIAGLGLMIPVFWLKKETTYSGYGLIVLGVGLSLPYLIEKIKERRH